MVGSDESSGEKISKMLYIEINSHYKGHHNEEEIFNLAILEQLSHILVERTTSS